MSECVFKSVPFASVVEAAARQRLLLQEALRVIRRLRAGYLLEPADGYMIRKLLTRVLQEDPDLILEEEDGEHESASGTE